MTKKKLMHDDSGQIFVADSNTAFTTTFFFVFVFLTKERKKKKLGKIS